MSELLTIKEVMGALKVSRTTAYGYVSQGRLKVCRIGRMVRVKSEDLERFIEGAPIDEYDKGKHGEAKK